MEPGKGMVPRLLCPHVEISAVAVVVLALAWLKKKKKNNNNQKEDEHSGVCYIYYFSEAFC